MKSIQGKCFITQAQAISLERLVPPKTRGWEARNVVAGGGVVRGGALVPARLVDLHFWIEPDVWVYSPDYLKPCNKKSWQSNASLK